MSSAERFVRHHKLQTDRAVSRAYVRLAADPRASATFQELLEIVRNRARPLIEAPIVNGEHPGVEALVNLARFQNVHLRSARWWPGTSKSWRPAVSSLAQHLICKYPVAPFLAAAWYDAGGT